MAVNPRTLRTVLASAALIASAAAAAALASSRTAAPPPQSALPAPVPTPDPPQDAAPAPAPAPVRNGRRLWRLLQLVPVLAMIAASIWGAIVLKEPDWARWTLIDLALVLPTCLGIALLIGPVARRLAGETVPLTAAERKQMTAGERVEAVNAARHTLIQAVTGLVVIGGVVFTAGGLYYTAQTWRTGQETLKATQQQQITDRYTKAVEQIGSAKSVEVRIGGLYALKRIAQDSPPDAETIEDVVVAFILEHDLDVAATPAPKGTPLKTSARRHPGSDVSAALRVLGVISKSRGSQPDITSAQFAQADWRGVNLSGAY